MEFSIQYVRFLLCVYPIWITCEGKLGLTSSSQHLGCVETGGLEFVGYLSDYTAHECVSTCHDRNRSVAALYDGHICYCGDSLDAPEDSMTCYNRDAYFCSDYWCGSGDALSVYRVCPLGYWGPDCTDTCPSSCGNRGCHVNSTRCLDCHGSKNITSDCQQECPPGTFGPDCTFSCSDRCLHGSCDPQDGRCLAGCQEGLKGPYCTDTCPSYRTKDVDCGWCGCSSCDANCTKGCFGGWTGDRCDVCPTDRWGRSCDLECEPRCVCNVYDSCAACKPGFAGGRCESCVSGLYGDDCTHQCPQLCFGQTCDNETGHCASCVSGYYGATCTERCPSGCFGGECQQDTGHCEECYKGYYGLDCTEECPLHCLGGKCMRDTGYCEECYKGYYGLNCTEECPLHCLGGKCIQETGQCTACDKGFFGMTCTDPCPSQCAGGECSRDAGTCADCNPGYAGDKCQSYSGAADCEPGQPCSDSLSSTQNNQDAIIIGLGVLVGVLALTIIANLVYVNRKRLTALMSASERPLPPLPTVTYEGGYENPEECVRVYENQGGSMAVSGHQGDNSGVHENQGDTAREYENHGASVRVSGVTENSPYDHIDPQDIDFSSPTYEQIQQNK